MVDNVGVGGGQCYYNSVKRDRRERPMLQKTVHLNV